jgi:20S proteasome alpha/beta subunit
MKVSEDDIEGFSNALDACVQACYDYSFLPTPSGLWREVPALERRDMTVCIAAACDSLTRSTKIVLCSDMKASSKLGDTDHNLKDQVIAARWRCLTSGHEDEIAALTSKLRNRFKVEPIIDETNVGAIVRAALNERLLEKKEEFIQGTLAISYERFLKEGKIILPEDRFRYISMQAETIKLNADLIVAGFTSDGMPMILETDGRCTVKIRDNYAVVGEGALLAESSLTHRQHTETMSLYRAMYCVFEAKKLAERLSSVGQHHTIIVMEMNAKGLHVQRVMNRNGEQFLWTLWLEHGPKDLPWQIKRRQKSSMFESVPVPTREQVEALFVKIGEASKRAVSNPSLEDPSAEQSS